MTSQRQREEIDRNYDAFMAMLPSLLDEHRDQEALMRHGRIVGYFDKAVDAYRAGVERFPDGIFSIQEVTDEPIHLGYWANA
ncbi:MAG TPA: hypothetical protein VFP12_01505 [Allosphingosinicella sp.]|nr:hypothetical protein [Allosphingosinicella sp.]